MEQLKKLAVSLCFTIFTLVFFILVTAVVICAVIFVANHFETFLVTTITVGVIGSLWRIAYVELYGDD